MGDLERVSLSEAIRKTFLQHPKHNRIPKGTDYKYLTIPFGETTVAVRYKPFAVERPYAHASAPKLLLSKRGRLSSSVPVKGWLYPGAAERHSGYDGTEIREPPDRFICLLYAPVASLYYTLRHRDRDGKLDSRRGTAIVLPHIHDLELYNHCFTRYLQTPVERLSADGVGDAALSALIALRAGGKLQHLGITGCTVTTMGSVPWSSQQKTRTATASIEKIDDDTLDLFDVAWRCLPNKKVQRPRRATRDDPSPADSLLVATIASRGLIADNVVDGRDWFEGFTRLMRSKNGARSTRFDRGGLNKMINEMTWQHEADRKFVMAVHAAIRNRYGMLADRAKQSGETPQFDREFERMRVGLMRVKNAQTLRAELADLFARGGANKTLQESWQQVLPLFSGSDWQRARDLALLALASYTGRGAEDVEVDIEDEDEEV